MILVAYLREGRVHASREAYEGGDGVADYDLTTDLEGRTEIETTIAGQRYRSLWCWAPDAKRHYGAAPLIRISETTEGK